MEIFNKDMMVQELLASGLSICLAGAGFWDLKKGKVPNKWLLFWFAAGFAVFAWERGIGCFWYLFRCGMVTGAFFPLFLFRMIGAGDIKCMALICGYLGFLSGGRVIGIGLVIGSVWSLTRLVGKGILWERFWYLVSYCKQVYHDKKIAAYYVMERDGREITIPFVFCLAAGMGILKILEVLE